MDIEIPLPKVLSLALIGWACAAIFTPLNQNHVHHAAWACVATAVVVASYVLMEHRIGRKDKVILGLAMLGGASTTVALFICHHRFVWQGVSLGILIFVAILVSLRAIAIKIQELKERASSQRLDVLRRNGISR